jgi:hypothetical protein
MKRYPPSMGWGWILQINILLHQTLTKEALRVAVDSFRVEELDIDIDSDMVMEIGMQSWTKVHDYP